MATNLGNEGPPLARKSLMGRRRRRRRESALVWWIGFAVLVAATVHLRSWVLALLTLTLWCLYEFVFVPTLCRVVPRKGHACPEPARGRLFACEPHHQQLKNDALWRMALLSNPFRKPSLPDPNRETGTVVAAGKKGRATLTLWPDRLLIIAAAVGTLAAVAGMLYRL
ncbi:hypothetical protein [Actinomadura kijaniata]|uniref:hypothetical protein n=1 Tax=Actinomadura kijaniata TaxID=46161 RepID=UPI000836B19A|nr:hypothetical protein [Actinomadura kijaniata]